MRWVVVLLLAWFCRVDAFGQTGVIQGRLLDPQGAAIAGATVSAVEQTKHLVVRQTTSETEGSFQLSELLPGIYAVKAEKAGFKTFERKGLVLDPNQIMDLEVLVLPLGSVAESVTVEATTPMVETGTGQKSFVISDKQVTELSLNGRDFSSLMYTLPGVSSTQQSDFNFGFGATNTFNVNGSRSSMNNMTLDGAHNTDAGDNGSQYTQLSLDAVREFKVQTSVFAAEHGRNPGVLISATTKSGGQQFHGTLYEFLRNDALDANTFFGNALEVSKSFARKVRFNQFGGNLGGPIPLAKFSTRGNPKLFFFFNHEGTRGSIPNPTPNPFVDVPNAASLAGDFRTSLKGTRFSTAPNFDTGTVFVPGTIVRDSGGNIIDGTPYGAGCTTTFPVVDSPNCNVIPQADFNQNAAAFLKVLNMAPRFLGSPTPGNNALVRVPLSDSHALRKNQETLRIDYIISPRTTLFFRWVNDGQHEEQRLGVFTSTPYPVYPMFREKPGSSWSWNLVKVFSPTLSNEFVFAYDHQSQIVDVAPGTDLATYDRDQMGFKFTQLFPNANIRNRFPGFNCAVGSCNFSTFPSNWFNDGKDYGWTDNLTKVHGAHALKTGIYFNLDDKQQQPSWTDGGVFDFSPNRFNPNDTNNGLVNLLLGNYTSFRQSNGKFLGSFRYLGLEFYGQDTWKAARRLTLEFGVRYVYLGPTYTRGQILANYFDPSLYDPSKAAVFDVGNNLLTRGSIVSGNAFNGMVQEGGGIIGPDGHPTAGFAPIASGFGEHHKNQVSPRFGFAFDPMGNGKTAIRGGFGTFFERVRQNVNNFDALGNPPLLYTPQLPPGKIEDLSPSLLTTGLRFPVDIRAFDKGYKTPTIYSWSFGIQRQLGKANSLDVSYVANTARHLQLIRNINNLSLGTTTCSPAPCSPVPNGVNNAARPFKGYAAINFTGYDGNSSYHSLQARLSRRFATHLTANVAYTWSKAIDQVDTDDTFNGCGYFLECAREKGPAGFDRTHMFNFDYVYQLPKLGTRLGNTRVGRKTLDGWQISGVTRIWSGLSFTVGTPGDAGTLAGNLGMRADYIGGPLYEPSQPLPSRLDPHLQWFNPYAFAQPLNGTLGNTGRNILRKPGLNNWNLSLFKNTKIGERLETQFRFEAFNIFNHTQFFGLNTSIFQGVNSPGPGKPVTQNLVGTTGQITSTRDPRNIQLGFKLYF
jgi:hypothetical protein